MLRRLASLGHQTPDEQEHMSPSPGDDTPSQEAKSSGGFAGVIKGLATGKLTKSHPSLQQLSSPATLSQSPQQSQQPQPAVSESIADGRPVSHSVLRGLTPEQVALFNQLKNKNGQLNERAAAASSLRYSIADYPLHPVCLTPPHSLALLIVAA